MDHATPLLTTIALGLVAAFALGMIAKGLRLPPIVGYLAAGIVIGPYTPGINGDQDVAFELAEIGVILLMFGVGLHFNYKDLLAVAKIAVPGAIGQMVAAIGLGYGMGLLMGWTHAAALLFGLALSVASTVVLLRALEERQLLDTRSGHVAVGWLIVEDIAIVLALVMVPVLAEGVEGSAVYDSGDGAGGVGTMLLSLLWTIGRVGLFVAFMFVVGRRVIPWVLAKVAGTGSRELFTLGVLAIGLGVAVGAAELFDISFALGAFFAGMMLKESELSGRAADDSLPLRDAFAVLFFVSVGMLVDPAVVVEEPLAVAATVAIIVVGKAIVAFIIVKALRNSTTMALVIAASLAQIGEFSFILVTLGMELEMLPQLASDLVLAGAILSILLNPVIFALAHRRQKYRERVLEASGADARARIGDDFPHQYDLSGHVIVVGYGRVGSRVARGLWDAGVSTVVIDDDEDRVTAIREEGHEAILGNALRGAALRKGGIEHARCVVVAVPNGLEAGEIVAKARERGPQAKILARTHHEDEIDYLRSRGADEVIMGEREIAALMVGHVLGAQQN